MLDVLELGPATGIGGTGDQVRLRKKMAEQLVIEESRHRRWRRCTSGPQSAST
ncbi:MAG TPA: hypothetical protein VMU95_08230 [Trebonia sp.]|nr:hypothetical protein [Trebonia sp.]